jgi:hypothetical protein
MPLTTHPPDPEGRPCIACTDPDQYAAWLASQRSQADQYGRWAETLRAAGEVMGERDRWAVVRGEDPADFGVLRVRLCGDANVLAMRARFIRDRVGAVSAAHEMPVQATLPTLDARP